ncbi:serine protease AprX [Marininema mesophilum]|uniref:Serine protease AprX n=1 Tax=Marininema mesophilum TaxID=1048340 RepID=A0A1H2WJW6_9BACL|nr:S8 family peptidase [Marininema mesophilum]SDW80289.1 serine protease AprX [Marininema mesophilum]
MNYPPSFYEKIDQPLFKHVSSMIETGKEVKISVVGKMIKHIKGEKRYNSLLYENGNIHQFQHLPFFSGSFTLSEIIALASLPEIESLYLNRHVHAFCERARKTTEADIVKKRYGLTGKGVTVAVLDSGIYPHPDFTYPSNRIKGFKDFVHDHEKPYDDNGHGTHVAGCIAGNGYSSNGKYKGIAPQAKLLVLKVLDKNGMGTLSTVLAAIDYCLEHQQYYNIKIMNLSFGLSIETAINQDPIAVAAGIVVSSGIVICAAADNTSIGGIASPASHPFVIAVGSKNDRASSELNEGMQSIYTSHTRLFGNIVKPDFFFPGIAVTAPLSPYSILAKQLEPFVLNQHYMSLSGSSIATGLCSGTVALFLQAYPPLSPADVLQYMKQTKPKAKIFKASSLFLLKIKEI